MELINEKIGLIQRIYKITGDIHEAAKKDDYKLVNDLLEFRGKDIEEICRINEAIKAENITIEKAIENKIKEESNKVVALDTQVKEYLYKRDMEIREEFEKIDTKLKQGNVDFGEEDKKPVGYFLDVKK